MFVVVFNASGLVNTEAHFKGIRKLIVEMKTYHVTLRHPEPLAYEEIVEKVYSMVTV